MKQIDTTKSYWEAQTSQVYRDMGFGMRLWIEPPDRIRDSGVVLGGWAQEKRALIKARVEYEKYGWRVDRVVKRPGKPALDYTCGVL